MLWDTYNHNIEKYCPIFGYLQNKIWALKTSQIMYSLTHTML